MRGINSSRSASTRPSNIDLDRPPRGQVNPTETLRTVIAGVVPAIDVVAFARHLRFGMPGREAYTRVGQSRPVSARWQLLY
jgi:hypothetical protein